MRLRKLFILSFLYLEKMTKLIFLDAEGLGKEVIKGNKGYNGWFGVGLTSRYYSEENLTLYTGWAVAHLNSFMFLVADDIERFNLMGFEGLSEKDALQEARKKGDEKYKMLLKIAEKFPHKVEVKRWKEIEVSNEYQKIFKQLDRDYEELPILKRHIEGTIWSNIRNKLELLKKEIGGNEFDKRFRQLIKYAISEISAIIYLGEYHIYPIKIGHKGERVYDNIVDRIYSKHYNKVHQKILPKGQRGNIYLQIV